MNVKEEEQRTVEEAVIRDGLVSGRRLVVLSPGISSGHNSVSW